MDNRIGRRRGREAFTSVVACASLLFWLDACASSPPAQPDPLHAGAAAKEPHPLEVPEQLAETTLERERVASGLWNPRGLQVMPDGSLLVAQAGTGDPDSPLTGSVVLLHDDDGDQDFLDPAEKRTLLSEQLSKNILDIVRRDEVFGLAGMDAGEGGVLVSLAFFGGPTKLLFLRDGEIHEWGSTHLNINDVTFDPRRKRWFGVASTTDEVVRLVPGGGVERVLKIPPLPNGQDAVPANLRSDPVTGDLLVTLFTGSPEGEEGGEGVELVPRAGGILRVDPDHPEVDWLVTGLTVPTDLEIGADGSIYVLEFCDSFLDPVPSRADMFRGPSHGGFRRFSGRLLKVDRTRSEITVVARGLDAPTNLARSGDWLYVAEGMGTPGRQIPGPTGVVELEGFVERVKLK